MPTQYITTCLSCTMQIARRGPSYPPHFRARHDYRGLDSTAETFGITILYWVGKYYLDVSYSSTVMAFRCSSAKVVTRGSLPPHHRHHRHHHHFPHLPGHHTFVTHLVLDREKRNSL